jgi:hypothetical protein
MARRIDSFLPKNIGTVVGGALCGLLVGGCASPGPPRPPSLRLPGAVTGLSAARVGDTVTLRFTMPSRTTDNLPIREATLTPVLCRGEAAGACAPLPPGTPLAVHGPHGTANEVRLDDHLSVALAAGPPRALQYRVELLNDRGRTAGFSAPVWTAAGSGLTAVAGLRVEATRLGDLIAWQPADAGDASRVILSRTRMSPPAQGEAKVAAPVLLRAEENGAHENGAASRVAQMLDTAVTEGVEYRYSAYRERTVTLAGHTISMRSDESAPVSFTLRDTFPPPVPTDLSVAGFVTQAAGTTPASYAVDLIWQPVEDPGLAGYNVYRERMQSEGAAAPRAKLNASPLGLPAFHDTTAQAGESYVYSVTSVDRKGNESRAVTVVLAAAND